MVRSGSYGQYYITACYRGMDIKVHTTDSEVWDWFNDEGNTKEEKALHRQSLRYCYSKIVAEYWKIR